MKEKKKKIFIAGALLVAVIALALTVIGAFGGLFGSTKEPIKASASSSDTTFYYDSVRFEATVNEDKTLDVTETLVTVWRTSYKTSLIRDIQRQSQTTRIVDGKKIKGKNYFAKISDISVTLDGGECDWHILPKSDDFYDSDFFSIEMKQPSGAYLQTDKPYTFVLNYKYDMGDDRVPKFDDLTYDIFGYDMNATKAFSAKITFPDSVTLNSDDVSLRFSRSSEGTPWKPEVKGNTVEVVTNGLKNGLTLQVILPKGTFTGGVTVYWFYWAFFLLAVAAVIGVAVLFVKNLPVKPLEVVEFYPPEGLSVMKFSAIWHKAVKSQDAAALILKWADMGLITIEKDRGSNLTLRLNNPDENVGTDEDAGEFLPENLNPEGKKYFDSPEEKKYFKTLFSGIGGSSTVFSTAAFKLCGETNQRKLYDATKKLTESVKLSEVVHPVGKVRKLIPFMGLVPAAAIMAYNCIIGSTFLPLFFLIFLAAGTFAGTAMSDSDGKVFIPIIFIFPLMFFAMPYGIFIWQFAMPIYDYGYLLYIAPVVYFICMFILPFFVGKRTDEANKIYGRILGFKKFLLTAELSRIELMFDENPDYFSDILPWCMIMGISDKVQKRFAALKMINMPKVLQDNIDIRWVSRSIYFSSLMGAPRSSGSGGSFGGGGGGRGGSFGGGGGGGGSRSR